MPLRLQRPVSGPLNEKLIKAYAQEATRLRELTASGTTDRLRSRPLKEANNQDRLALAARRGVVQPHRLRPSRTLAGLEYLNQRRQREASNLTRAPVFAKKSEIRRESQQ